MVPTNKAVAREDFNDVVFRNVKGKWNAVTTEITRMNKTGRPVLVGTTSVETSELVSSFLTDAGITHEVLNAKPENVERESEIVAQSGRRNAVTIATNMAGRGTDIILGGNAEFMARLKLREHLFPAVRPRPPPAPAACPRPLPPPTTAACLHKHVTQAFRSQAHSGTCSSQHVSSALISHSQRFATHTRGRLGLVRAVLPNRGPCCAVLPAVGVRMWRL